jgi:hypothetical protein
MYSTVVMILAWLSRVFDFTDDTPETTNCLLELYKIAYQPQQNTIIANPAPAGNNPSDSASAKVDLK